MNDWKVNECILCGKVLTADMGLNHDCSCNHEGHVLKGRCERCGEEGLESDAETYAKENPR